MSKIIKKISRGMALWLAMLILTIPIYPAVIILLLATVLEKLAEAIHYVFDKVSDTNVMQTYLNFMDRILNKIGDDLA